MNFEMENPSVLAAINPEAQQVAAQEACQPDYHMDNSFNGNIKNEGDFQTGNENNGNGNNNNNSNNDQDNHDNSGGQDYSNDGNGDDNDPQKDDFYTENQTNKRQASDFDSTSVSNNNSHQKRQKTGMNNMGNNQQQRNYPRRDGQVDLRILLPSKDAGAIIGRGGANIKKLRQEHKTQIQVPDCNGPERLLLISGDIETCINALLDVIPLLEENQKFNSNEGVSTELRLLVHQSQAGCIIGRGGDKIKDLRIKHNLDMKVYSECAPMSTERVCQMKGKSPDIINCLREAIGLLESAPPKGMSRPYDPHNFDEFLSSQYGGFCNDKRGPGGGPGGPGGFQSNGGQRGGFQQNNMNRGNSNFNNNRGGGGFSRNNSNDGNGFNDNGGYQNNGMSRGGGRGGRGGFDRGGDRGGMNRGGGSDRGGRGGFNNNRGHSNDRGGGRGGFNNSRGNSHDRGSSRGGYNNNGNGRGGYNNNGAGQHQQNNSYNNHSSQQQQGAGGAAHGGGNQPGVQTNQVTIPNELAGAVIGPKGAKIQQIRDQSGAGITIDKPTPGSNDRIITIQGNAEQIQNAQYLLQLTVKQSGLWQGN